MIDKTSSCSAATPSSPDARPPQIDSHVPWLDGLRGIAAFWVVVSHVQILTGLRYVAVLSWGDLAVDLFMILSGFLMANHYIQRRATEPWDQTRTAVRFWVRRFFRIAPLYYALLATAMLLGPTLGEYRTAISDVWTQAATPLDRYNNQTLANAHSDDRDRLHRRW